MKVWNVQSEVFEPKHPEWETLPGDTVMCGPYDWELATIIRRRYAKCFNVRNVTLFGPYASEAEAAADCGRR
jgi:hypothetical protein